MQTTAFGQRINLFSDQFTKHAQRSDIYGTIVAAHTVYLLGKRAKLACSCKQYWILKY
jgi:hypothetical protein